MKRRWPGQPLGELINRELTLNPEIAECTGSYAMLSGDLDAAADFNAFMVIVSRRVGEEHCGGCSGQDELLVFDDRGVQYLFDPACGRILLAWGRTRSNRAPRDAAFHKGYPPAGDKLDKGHLWAHAQGGREGGPNYVRQLRTLNQAITDSGRLWRAIERHLARSPNSPAFIRPVYAADDCSDQPTSIDYGIWPDGRRMRVFTFLNQGSS